MKKPIPNKHLTPQQRTLPSALPIIAVKSN
jgi:hypothetical protein